MRVGTISLNINTIDLNYGAVLHSWAFQQVLKRKPYVSKTEIIDYVTPTVSGIDRRTPAISHLRRGEVKSAVAALLRHKSHVVRFDKFESFISNRLEVSEQKFTYPEIASARLKYDAVVCESDVIWSPSFFEGSLDPVFFLNIPSMGSMRRIAYSASAANAIFSEEQLKDFKSNLNALDYISCRESYLVDLIKRVAGRNAQHVLDPTLLLNKDDYSQLIVGTQIGADYALLYFPVQYPRTLARKLVERAHALGLKAVDISRYPFSSGADVTIKDAGIEEFISLIAGAAAIWSNSFHATCFALVFHKEFLAFERKTGRKTQDLCEWFSLEDRLVRGVDFVEPASIDWCGVDRLREEYKAASHRWLDEAMCGED